MSNQHLLFTYGTLQREFSNHRYLAGSKFLGTGRTKEKYALYCDGLPFLILNEPVSQIQGELYQVDDITLDLLDDLEGHPNWYRREQAEICLDDGSQPDIKAWIFFSENNSGTLVPSGIFSSNSF